MGDITRTTKGYVMNHLSVKKCLAQGIINYSALARQIIKETDIIESSFDAVVIALRRISSGLKKEKQRDVIYSLFKNSTIEIKNRISVYTIRKGTIPESLIDIEKIVKKRNDVFFAIEGKKSITLIINERYSDLVKEKLKRSIINTETHMSMILIESPGIDMTPGATSFITGLFYENNINIAEFMSCWDDSIIVIESKDLPKALEFLKL